MKATAEIGNITLTLELTKEECDLFKNMLSFDFSIPELVHKVPGTDRDKLERLMSDMHYALRGL